MSPCLSGSISACTMVFIVSNGITRHHDIKPVETCTKKMNEKNISKAIENQIESFSLIPCRTRKSASQYWYRHIDVVQFLAILHFIAMFSFVHHPISRFKLLNSIFIGKHIKAIWKDIAANGQKYSVTLRIQKLNNVVFSPANHRSKSSVEANRPIFAIDCFDALYWSLTFISSATKVI